MNYCHLYIIILHTNCYNYYGWWRDNKPAWRGDKVFTCHGGGITDHYLGTVFLLFYSLVIKLFAIYNYCTYYLYLFCIWTYVRNQMHK